METQMYLYLFSSLPITRPSWLFYQHAIESLLNLSWLLIDRESFRRVNLISIQKE